MKSRWNDDEARDYCRRYQARGESLALRIYTSRLIGGDPQLVLHGGGNTSVKATARDLFGREIDVMHVKGSGSDLGAVEPQGLPAVRLAPLRELRQLERLADADMVNAVRAALLDSTAPNPSVEALLHAFLPHRFVDHTHADAILVLTDQPDSEDYVRDAFGDEVAVLPWIMPGFPLAKAVIEACERRPDCRGILLRKHGLFTFGDDARESYERTIELVDRAEHYISRRIGGVPAMLCGEPAPLAESERRAVLAVAMPTLRGAVATRVDSPIGPQWLRPVAVARIGEETASFAAHSAAPGLCAQGPITPDHVIRTKGHYMFLSREEVSRPDLCHRGVANFAAAYQRYYDECCRGFGSAMIAPEPVVAVIEGTGLIAFGETAR
ncbi:MAG: class II aldolase/adducin family protein, partial [Planctomycetes bacterium]|nr:class II aldolase/adducin family protein [Planctomycetota bacterium]